MSNSPLTNYTKISPNKTSPRNHKIDTITIHCYVGQASVESMGAWFVQSSAQCSCNYGIGSDGRIALIVDEADRSWCSSNKANDHRAITIECASDKTDPYAINDKVYASLINLCADICKRNNIKELKWKANKSLIGQVDQQNITVHRWFANKACPGDYIYNRLGQIAKEVNVKLGIETSETTTESYYRVRKTWSDASSQKGAFTVLDNAKKCADENPGCSVFDENGKVVYEGKTETTTGLQAKSLLGLTEAEVVNKVGPLFTEDQKNTNILASVSMAQFILESGYGNTDLAQNANNCFGMKTTLSGNTWSGSTWDGTNKYTKVTKECYDGKTYVDVAADFRKYPCVEDSIGDHSAYLLGAMNGTKKRYDGLKGCTDYKTAIQIIKDGGYATDPNYVNKICSIISKWNLTQYDAVTKTETKTENASSVKVFKPYSVKVDIPYLNIRTGAGTDYAKTGNYTGKGVFTIVEEKAGTGSKSGWGRLKSGAGWISLDYAKKV